jgi:hypothetical protein
VLWQGGRQVVLNRITLGELIAFYTFTDAIDLSDDRARLRHQTSSARRGVDGQAELYFSIQN